MRCRLRCSCSSTPPRLYLAKPSASPTTPHSANRKSTRATNRPYWSRISACSSGTGRSSRRIATRLSDSSTDSLRGSLNSTALRAARVPGHPRQSASTSYISAGVTVPARRAASAATTDSAKPCSRPRSTMVRATLVTGIRAAASRCSGPSCARCRWTPGWFGDRPGAIVTHGEDRSRTGSRCQSAADRWLRLEPLTVFIAAMASFVATNSRLRNVDVLAGSVSTKRPRRTRRIRPTSTA